MEKYYAISPYVYCANNPLKYIDPIGEISVWPLSGPALDYDFQVYDNYQKGSSGYNAWVGNVNFVSVGLSAVNPTDKLKVLKTVVVEAVKAAAENTTIKGRLQLNTEVKDVVTKVAVNTAVDVGLGKLAKAGSMEGVQNAKKEVPVANKQVKTAERQANRSPNSTKKAKNVNTAQSNTQAARNKHVRTQILNSSVRQAPNATQEAAKVTTNRIQKDEEKR